VETSGDTVQTAIPSGDIILAGEVAWPSTPVTAAVAMIGGSGPADRSNEGYFVPIRDHLLARGHVVLSYDKRGVGESTGHWQAATMTDLAQDAVAALTSLLSEVPAHVLRGFYGHSEGGWVALRAARLAPELVDFVVTTSCPGMSPGAQDRHALVGLLGARSDRADVLALYDQLIQAARQEQDYPQVRTLLSSSAAYPALAAAIGDMDEALWRFWSRKQPHDPLVDARALRSPWLCAYGGSDAMVPVPQSIAAFAEVSCEPGRWPAAATTFHVVPGADHRMTLGACGQADTGYLDAMSAWVASLPAPVRAG
jgi:pimeloyl-ACP methyl ester carboxylesterase